jgi:uncharacterized protein (DUF1330 family)
MAKGYIVYTEQIHDQAKMDEYGALAMPSLFSGGGTVIALDDAVYCREGSWHGNRTVILEFESVDAARAWYESPDYQAAIPLRQAGGETNVAIISGFDLPVA